MVTLYGKDQQVIRGSGNKQVNVSTGVFSVVSNVLKYVVLLPTVT